MATRATFQLLKQFSIARFSRHNFRRYSQTVSKPNAQSSFVRLWNSEIGPKTVHFWAPIMKWALVLTGVSDFARPAQNLSATQNAALTATGAIWTRWCLIIKPKNYMLAAVNFFLFCVGSTQLMRIFAYRRSLTSKSLPEETAAFAQETASAAEEIVEHPKKVVEKVKSN